MSQTAGRDELLSVGALHAFVYCPRLFYFEEVERVRVADAAVLAGRSLHVVQKTAPAAKLEPEVSNWARPYMESDELGIHGTADLLRHRDGGMIVHELKRGRSAWDGDTRAVWDTDRLQVGAYALLAERHLGVDVREARVRYAADNVTVRVAVDADLRQEVLECIAQARALRNGLERPPVTSQERKCHRCSLASVCLPEEARLSAEPRYRLLRLLPPHPRGESVHVTEAGARVGRSGDCLRVELRKGSRQTLPIAQVGSLTLHGMAQVSTQALRLCADRDVPVHWVTAGGGLVGSLAPSAASGHRHMRQFEALREPARRLELSKILVRARLSSQLRYLLRATQKRGRTMIAGELAAIRRALRQLDDITELDVLRGHEGAAAAAYFGALPELCGQAVPAALRPARRSRRPAKDRFSVLLNYGYGMLYREVVTAILAVGLHPAVGFYHRLRSAAQTLALDVMELFRVPLVDMPLLGAINRQHFDVADDFVERSGGGVSLSPAGRGKAIALFERRRHDHWKHTVVGYSLSYARIIELELRLLEKEWTGEPGLFGRLRIR